MVHGQPRQKFTKTPSESIGWASWLFCDPTDAGSIARRIPVWGWPQTKMWDPVWKITKSQKRWRLWLKYYSTCLASSWPWVQIPIPQKNLPANKKEIVTCTSISKIKNIIMHSLKLTWKGNKHTKIFLFTTLGKIILKLFLCFRLEEKINYIN
jgi:hypothetical protein